MKRVFIFASVFVLLFLFVSSPVYSQEKVGQTRVIQEWGYDNVGARSWGMGGAFVGQADDISAYFWNPAGLTQLERMGIYVELFSKVRNKLYGMDVSSQFIPVQALQLGYKYRNVILSLGYTKSYNLNFDGYLVETYYSYPLDEDPYGNYQFKLKINDSISQHNFTCAFQLNEIISLGSAIFYNHYKILEEIEETSLKQTGSNFSGLFGFLLRPNSHISCGLSVMPQSRVDLECNEDLYPCEFVENEEKFPTKLRFDLSISPLHATNINLDIQTTYWDAVYSYLEDKTDFYFGIEKRIYSNFSLRTGAYTKLTIHDFWYDDSYFLTLGFGLSIKPIDINLSLQDNQVLSRLVKGGHIEPEQTFVVASMNCNF